MMGGVNWGTSIGQVPDKTYGVIMIDPFKKENEYQHLIDICIKNNLKLEITQGSKGQIIATISGPVHNFSQLVKPDLKINTSWTN